MTVWYASVITILVEQYRTFGTVGAFALHVLLLDGSSAIRTVFQREHISVPPDDVELSLMFDNPLSDIVHHHCILHSSATGVNGEIVFSPLWMYPVHLFFLFPSSKVVTIIADLISRPVWIDCSLHLELFTFGTIAESVSISEERTIIDSMDFLVELHNNSLSHSASNLRIPFVSHSLNRS